MTDIPTAAVAGHELPELRLKLREDRRLSAGHLWVFSNEVDTARTPLSGFATGALCRIVGDRDRFLGYGYVNPHALICARILGRDPEYPPGKSLIVHRLQVALELRKRLYAQPYYRLVYGESDGLPGLVLDRYGDVVVGQIGTAGMEALKDEVVAAIDKVIAPAAIVWKNDSGARELEGSAVVRRDRARHCRRTSIVEENGVRFRVADRQRPEDGLVLRPGRQSRSFVRYVNGARVLDVSATSAPGARGREGRRARGRLRRFVGARARACCSVRRRERARSARRVRDDAFDALAACARPARSSTSSSSIRRPSSSASKRPAERHRGVSQAEPARDAAAARATASWSRARARITCHRRSASTRSSSLRGISDRLAQIVEVGGQAPDHPIHPAIPETRYLKALFCRVTYDWSRSPVTPSPDRPAPG